MPAQKTAVEQSNPPMSAEARICVDVTAEEVIRSRAAARFTLKK